MRGTDLADLAHRTLVLGMILDAVEGAGEAGFASVDGGVGGAADVKLAEGVELDVEGVVRGAFTNSLDFSRLWMGQLRHLQSVERVIW